MDVGPMELIIVLLIVLLIFGGAKLPKLARSMGQAASEFRKGLAHGDDDDEEATKASGGKGTDAKAVDTKTTDATTADTNATDATTADQPGKPAGEA